MRSMSDQSNPWCMTTDHRPALFLVGCKLILCTTFPLQLSTSSVKIHASREQESELSSNGTRRIQMCSSPIQLWRRVHEGQRTLVRSRGEEAMTAAQPPPPPPRRRSLSSSSCFPAPHHKEESGTRSKQMRGGTLG